MVRSVSSAPARYQVLGQLCQKPLPLCFRQCEGFIPSVQKILGSIVERFLLLDMVVEHLPEAGQGGMERMFKNARFPNRSRMRLLVRAGGLNPMTMIPVTYGYAWVRKSDDGARNLET